MFVRKSGTAPKRPTASAQIARPASAAAARTQQAPGMDLEQGSSSGADDFMRQLQKHNNSGEGSSAAGPTAGANRKTRPTRALAPPNKDWPELDFLEEKSQSAFDSQLDALWLENNADFHYCDLHQQVCEMMANHPDDHYNPDCQKCLKKEHGGLLEMFFQREGMDLNMTQARDAWLSYHNRKAEVHKQLMTNPAGNRPLQKQFDLRERAAFLRYAFLAWEKNKARVEAIKQHAANPGASSAFNMLPTAADEELCAFVNNATTRNMETGAGLQGKSCNVKPCALHSGDGGAFQRRGHAIQVFNKYRYFECGICYRTREQTQTQREADTYDSSANAEERPAIHFAPGLSKGRFKGASSSAAAASH
jgi:hypothetical protein